jgi:hypothetical protein
MLSRNRHALEVLEAAATIPIMLLILVAVVNLGLAIYAQQAVQNAANYGARMGSTAQACRSCTAYGAAWSSISGSGVQNPGVEVLAPGGVVGSTLKIRVTGEVPDLGLASLMAYFGGGRDGPFRVSAEATFRAEGW